MATNVTNPKNLTDYVVLAETITIASGPAAPFELVMINGTYPADATVQPAGILIERNGNLGTIATEGIAIAKVAANQTIAEGAPLAAGADGTVKTAASGDVIIGYSRDTVNPAQTSATYVRVKLSR